MLTCWSATIIPRQDAYQKIQELKQGQQQLVLALEEAQRELEELQRFQLTLLVEKTFTSEFN
jgi:predicted CopG family antitoxin